MRRTAWLGFFLVAAVAVSPAMADEVVHFKNGTSMAVVGHSIEDGMITVDLGGGTMAFPLDKVERVESEDGVVVDVTDAPTPNRMVPRASDAGTVHGSAPSRYARGSSASTVARSHAGPTIERDAAGARATAAFPNANSRGRRQFSKTGSRDVWGTQARPGSDGITGRKLDGQVPSSAQRGETHGAAPRSRPASAGTSTTAKKKKSR